MGDTERDRSRSPVGRETEFVSFERIEGLREAYRKTRTQKRGGNNHRRRLKGVCVGLLRCFIQLIDLVLQEFAIGNRDKGVHRTIAIVDSKLLTDWTRSSIRIGFLVVISTFWVQLRIVILSQSFVSLFKYLNLKLRRSNRSSLLKIHLVHHPLRILVHQFLSGSKLRKSLHQIHFCPSRKQDQSHR